MAECTLFTRPHVKNAKTFLLDTNVLLHDPRSIYNFEEHNVVLPVEVLEELDRFKTEPGERGQNSRQVHRELRKLFTATPGSMTKGVKLPSGGRLSVVINPFLISEPAGNAGWTKLKTLFPRFDRMDNRILACCVYLTETLKGRSKFALVTKDINMQLKALSLGLQAEDYRNDKVEENVHDAETHATLKVSVHELQRFASSGGLHLDGARGARLEVNEYVLLRAEDGHTMPARHRGDGELVRLQIPQFVRAMGGVPIKPRNLEQQYFLDALLDPTISLVTCYGRAGTGKTILSITAGLHEITQQHYDGLSITRPVVPMGREIGFLPGDLNEKMSPWLQPYYDALSLILPAKPQSDPAFADKKKSKRHGQHPFGGETSESSGGSGKPYQRLMDAGIIEIEALTFIRGRSIPNRFFILDEAQQLTPHEVKTVISRMSEGSKLVLIGDPTQIDNPYVDAQSNGLVYARSKLGDQAIAAHVKLARGERSELANLAVKML